MVLELVGPIVRRLLAVSPDHMQFPLDMGWVRHQNQPHLQGVVCHPSPTAPHHPQGGLPVLLPGMVTGQVILASLQVHVTCRTGGQGQDVGIRERTGT